MKRPRTVAVVQARLNSARLPGKTLLDLGGRAAVLRVLERAAAIPWVDEVVAAVPPGPVDAPLRRAIEPTRPARVFAGSENDGLDGHRPRQATGRWSRRQGIAACSTPRSAAGS